MQGAQIGHSVERTTEVARHPASSFPFGLLGREVSEKTATRRYEKYGRWKFLAYKCERIARRSNYIN